MVAFGARGLPVVLTLLVKPGSATSREYVTPVVKGLLNGARFWVYWWGERL